MKNKNNGYDRQFKLSVLNLLGELPNFFALLFSAISTRAVLVFVDLIDTSGNVLRNLLVVYISKRLKKDLRYQYNYGIGKIEAMSSMICDFVMVLSLVLMLGFAIKDLIFPRPIGSFLLFVVFVKVLNVLGDAFVFWRQRKICRSSDSLVMKSAHSVALKNLVFDLTSLSALILIQLFGDKKIFWYLSPVVSLALGGYLLYNTVKRLNKTVGIILDKSADEDVQISILQTLTSHYEKYEHVINVQSRVSGGVVYVDLNLGFAPDMTYSQMKEIADTFAAELTKSIPKCEVSLRILGNSNTNESEENNIE
ncbi:MAG: cation transporter [Clostridia bacterium]|nr:cation transporter [Clostridia bacterium]